MAPSSFQHGLLAVYGMLSSASIIFTLSAVYIMLFYAPDCDATPRTPTLLFYSNTVLGSLMSVIVQHFLIYRFWRLSKQSFISILLSLLSIASLIIVILAITPSGPLTSRQTAPNFRVSPVTAFGFIAAVDVLTSVSMLWYLWRLVPGLRSTRGVLQRVAILAIQTGVTTTVITLASLILLLTFPQSFLFNALAMPAGHCYNLTMLFTLLTTHQALRPAANKTPVSSETTGQGSCQPLSQGPQFTSRGANPVNTLIFNW
jgi:hypothetical protein